ncbi:MAG: hypothetical protein GY807_24830 [Gammaproteobacteria bacterium]|nr:hypothetical protein [Gammaproteobacteria bacterium]
MTPFEYTQSNKFDQPLDPSRCKASVAQGGMRVGFYQCSRKAVKDGWCKQHHPDTEKKRREESRAKYNAACTVTEKRNRLYHAASDLLEACEEVEWGAETESGNHYCPWCGYTQDSGHDKDCKLAAAIAKAKGQSK